VEDRQPAQEKEGIRVSPEEATRARATYARATVLAAAAVNDKTGAEAATAAASASAAAAENDEIPVLVDDVDEDQTRSDKTVAQPSSRV
jgi:tetrahydrodipicolinate N-succinyltransferase